MELEYIKWLLIGFACGAIGASLFWAAWAYNAMGPRK